MCATYMFKSKKGSSKGNDVIFTKKFVSLC